MRSDFACPLSPVVPGAKTVQSRWVPSMQVWVYPYPNTVEETPPLSEMARTSVMWGEFKHGVKRRRERSARGSAPASSHALPTLLHDAAHR